MPENARKNQIKWLYVTHDKGNLNQIKEALKNRNQDVWFQQEPAIFHIVCRHLDAAKKLLDAARNAGMKRSGLTALGNKLLVQIASTDQIITILAKEKFAIDDIYLNLLIEEANKKMKKNKERLDIFITQLRQLW